MYGAYLNTVEAAALEGTCRCCGRARPATLLWVRSLKGSRSVRVSDITLLLAKKKYTEVWTQKGFFALLDTSITSLEKRYPNEWIRLNRNCIARLECISRISQVYTECGDVHWAATVVGVPEPVKISRRVWPSVKAIIQGVT